MQMSVPTPTLALDTQAYVVRAHRMRGTVTAHLIRDFLRWVSIAAR
jgi:hypothetical protein